MGNNFESGFYATMAALVPLLLIAYMVEARDAGLPWVTFHTFRHTCASLLFEAGRDVEQVAAWLGHADPAFTLRTYVHLMDEGIGDAAFMDEAIRVRAPTAP